MRTLPPWLACLPIGLCAVALHLLGAREGEAVLAETKPSRTLVAPRAPQEPEPAARDREEERAELERTRRIREMVLAEPTAVMLGQVLEARLRLAQRLQLRTEPRDGEVRTR